MTDTRVRFKVLPRRHSAPTRGAWAAAAALLAGSLGLAAAPSAVAAASTTAAATAVTPAHTYVVTPNGVGMQNLAAIVEHVVKPGDVVEMADGVYRTGDVVL